MKKFKVRLSYNTQENKKPQTWRGEVEALDSNDAIDQAFNQIEGRRHLLGAETGQSSLLCGNQ